MWAMMMGTAGSSETLVNFIILHGATTRKTAMFLFDNVITSNLKKFHSVLDTVIFVVKIQRIEFRSDNQISLH
jgi:hypothetical protein